MRDVVAEATRLTRSGRLAEATALIKRSLRAAAGGAVDNPEHPPHPVSGGSPHRGLRQRTGWVKRDALRGRVGGPGPAPGGRGAGPRTEQAEGARFLDGTSGTQPGAGATSSMSPAVVTGRRCRWW